MKKKKKIAYKTQSRNSTFIITEKITTKWQQEYVNYEKESYNSKYYF